MSYAIIKTGGKQFPVEAGQTFACRDRRSTPVRRSISRHWFSVPEKTLRSAAGTVSATVVGHGRGEKIIVFKKKRRKQYKRKQGHRQGYTEIKIEKIKSRTAQPRIKEMAHKKGVGSSRNGRDSNAQRLGFKEIRRAESSRRQYSCSSARHEMEARQKCRPRQGRYLFALIEGFVKFEDKGRKGKFISVYAGAAARRLPKAIIKYCN